jgi:SAM-dependent methyltransferase
MWKLKAFVQFVLAHLPYGEQLNHLAQLAAGSFNEEGSLKGLLPQARYLRALNARFPIEGKTIVEIGPGWQGVGTLALFLFRPGRVYAIDHQPHLRFRLMQDLVTVATAHLPELRDASGISHDQLDSRLRSLAGASCLSDLLEAMHVTYIAPGDAADTGLEETSIDMVYSYGVLEHLSPSNLTAVTKETSRILKPDGRASHNVGLHDHFYTAGLGNSVNFLRYPEWLWSFVCYNKILYHNRLRLPHYLQLFDEAGLSIAWIHKVLLDSDIKALRAIRVDKRFNGMSEADLATAHLYVDLTRKTKL